VVGAVVLPVTGVTVGAVQMVRGVVNTAEAVSQTKKGKIWDQVWFVYCSFVHRGVFTTLVERGSGT
jgi:hypothetical protein